MKIFNAIIHLKFSVIFIGFTTISLFAHCNKDETSFNDYEILFPYMLKVNRLMTHGMINKYKNEDVSLLYSTQLTESKMFYLDDEKEQYLTQLEKLVQRMEESDAFTHNVNSIGLWNMRLYEAQLWRSRDIKEFPLDVAKLTIEQIRAIIEKQQMVLKSHVGFCDSSFSTVEDCFNNYNQRILKKILVEESLNESELEELRNQSYGADPAFSCLDISEGYNGFTPETAIDLRRVDFPVETLLNYADVHLNAAGIGIIEEDKKLEPNSVLYTSEFYHRQFKKKFVIYFLANPEKLEVH